MIVIRTTSRYHRLGISKYILNYFNSITQDERKALALERMYTYYNNSGITPPPRDELEDQINSEVEIMVSQSWALLKVYES
jgi:hypothetical protein